MTPLACPVCGALAPVAAMPHGDFAGAQVFRCGRCGHGVAAPVPPPEDLARHYAEVYAPRRANWLNDSLCRTMMERAAAQADFVARTLGRDEGGVVDGLRVFDLGCGLGALVAHMEGLGGRATGWDHDRLVVTYGHSVFAGADLRLGAPVPDDGVCDLLTLSHVVEHLPDLTGDLGGMLDLLRPGGLLFVEVPNVLPAFYAPGVDTESHVHFFSARSLPLLLSRLGLELLSCKSCGPDVDDFFAVPQGESFGPLFSRSWRHYDAEGVDRGVWLRALARRPLVAGRCG